MSSTGIVSLMYHEIELPGRATCHDEPGYVRYVVPSNNFREQLRWLKTAGWRGMSTDEMLSQPKVSGVALTFDDGCETDLIEAAPLLRELGFHATFYITVNFLGTRGFLSRSQLRELGDLGFEIGSHSFTHPYLPDLSPANLSHEIISSKTELEQIAGRPVEHFSCPGGRYDRRVQDMAKEAGYRSLATSRPFANLPDTDPFELGRVAVLRGTDLTAFYGLATGDDLWKIRIKDSLRSSIRGIVGNNFYDRMRSKLLDRRTL